MRVKLYLPATWALDHRAATHEDKKRKHNRRNSKQARREKRRQLNGE